MSQSMPFWIRQNRLLLLITLVVVLLCVITAITYSVVYSQKSIPPPQGKNCGHIYTNGMRDPSWNDTGTARQVGDCFWQAYQQCQASYMGITQMGVDTGTTSTLAFDQEQGNCRITDTSQFYSANFGGSHSSAVTSTCSSLKRTGTNLLFSGCISSDNTHPVSPSFSFSLVSQCGYINSGMSANVVKTSETCFAQDVQHCYASILHSNVNKTDAPNAHISRTFTFDEPKCVLTDQLSDNTNGQILGSYTCQGVMLQADGLHITKCGKDGDIVIPAIP